MDAHQRFFAKWAKHYERTPLLAPILRRQQDEALRRLAAQPGERVLDLSCGPGRALELLSKAGASAMGLDHSGHMIVRALEAGRREPLVWGDATHLPFKAKSFDALLSTNAFHHYPEPEQALREMRRVLKPNGRAVIVDPRLGSILSRMTIFGGEALLFKMRVHLHETDEWRAMGLAAGFSSADAEPLATFPLPATSVVVVLRA